MNLMKWFLIGALAALLFSVPHTLAQQPTSEPPKTETEETNIRAYVELLRADVNAKKTAIYTDIMQFNDEQAAKFWPIYREYDLGTEQVERPETRRDQRVRSDLFEHDRCQGGRTGDPCFGIGKQA